ncbi:MAG: LptF/LptG family permease [Hyphomicrobiaceae bacterium]
MTIFGRYVFRQAAGALLLILLSLSGIVWIALALRQLNLVTSQGQDTLMLLKMTTLGLPSLMVLIAPIALLIATIHTLNRLNGDSELIVLTASGAPIRRVAQPLLALAVILAAAIALVNHYVAPWSLRLLRDLVIQVRTDLIAQVLQPGRFSSPETGLTFHIRDRSLDGELRGLLVHDARERKQAVSYLADRAWIVKEGLSSYLIMADGHIIRQSAPKMPPHIVAFERYPVGLDNFEKKDTYIELRPRERFFGELARPRADDVDFKRQPGHFRAELHERFASTLYPFAFVLAALAFVGRAQSTRQNRVEAVVFAFLAAIACRLGGLAVNNLVVLRATAVPLLYGLPLGLIAFSLIAMVVGSGPQRNFKLRDRFMVAIDTLLAKLPRISMPGTRPMRQPAGSPS